MPEHRKRATKPKAARADQTKSPRTASGKKSTPETLAEATITAQEGLRERTEAGHHGGREQRRQARRRPIDRMQHRAAVRAGRKPVRRHAGELPLLLRAEDD